MRWRPSAIACLTALALVASSPARAQDSDGDGVPNAADSCALDWNPAQSDLDGDGAGDACDGDPDGDGLVGTLDGCPFTPGIAGFPPAPEIGADCPQPAFPLEVAGLDASEPLLVSVDLDTLPPRAEIVVRVGPGGDALESDVELLCRGNDHDALLDPDFFADPFVFKLDASARPVTDPLQNCAGPTPHAGTWTAPLFLPFAPAAFDNPGNPSHLACFLAVHYYGPDASWDARVEARSRVPESRNRSFCPQGCDDSLQFAASQLDADYGCFVPQGATFAFLDDGDPAIGQCSYVDPTPEGQNATIDYSVVTPDRWDCCIWQYEHQGVLSERGFDTFWTGGLPVGLEPDADLDGIHDRCDGCPATSDPEQRDADADGPGDACDACPLDPDPTNDDAIPAGDACQCSDVDASGSTDVADVVQMRRFFFGSPSSPAFDPARCRVSAGLDPFAGQCGFAGISAVRELLARSGALVESCD